MARPGLTKHPKFLRLVQMLGEPPAHVQGHLEFLWAVGYECGNPELGDTIDVELAAGWEGEAGKLTRALLKCAGKGRAGFIEPIPGQPGRYQIHDLLENAPDYVRSRQRMDRYRKRQRALAQEKQTETHSEPPENAAERTVTQPLRNCYPSPAPAPAPKEEDCSEPAKPAAEPPSPVLTFPVVGRGGIRWSLLPEKLAEYQASYPDLDILAECRKARQWCIDNPAKRKTARGMPAFLGRWLAKAQDNGRGASGNGRLQALPEYAN